MRRCTSCNNVHGHNHVHTNKCSRRRQKAQSSKRQSAELSTGREKLRLWLLSVSLLNTEREAQAKANKRQSADVREKESQAMATKRQSAEYREREAQAKASKHQSADVREKESQAMATKHQSAEYREREASGYGC